MSQKIKKGATVRIMTENLIRELRAAQGWQRDSQVTGTVAEIVGQRIGVSVDCSTLWFDSEMVEKVKP